MREIKFRIWDGNEIRQIPNYRLDCFGMIWWQFGYDEEKSCDPIRNKIMQYTGLKDKNNKEIYEGDIIRYDNLKTKDDKINVGVVTYREFGTRFIANTNNAYYGDEQFYQDYTEIIGNIYENPGLLIPLTDQNKND